MFIYNNKSDFKNRTKKSRVVFDKHFWTFVGDIKLQIKRFHDQWIKEYNVLKYTFSTFTSYLQLQFEWRKVI